MLELHSSLSPAPPLSGLVRDRCAGNPRYDYNQLCDYIQLLDVDDHARPHHHHHDHHQCELDCYHVDHARHHHHHEHHDHDHRPGLTTTTTTAQQYNDTARPHHHHDVDDQAEGVAT